MKKFNFYSVMRSGHTAILNWLCENNEKSVLYHIDFKKNKNTLRQIWWYQDGNVEKQKVRAQNYFQKRADTYDNLFYSTENDYNFNKDPIVIIRNPFNVFASRYQQLWCRVKSPQEIELFQNVVFNHLKSSAYKISFDKWFVNEDYRKKICRDLKLKYGTKGLERVNSASSFDKFRYRESAQEMNVLSRYKSFKNDERFQSLITDPIRKLWKEFKKENKI